MTKNLIPVSIIIAGLIIAGSFIFINQNKEEKTTLGEGLSVQEIAEAAIHYINENIVAEGLTASLLDVVEEGDVYKIKLKIGENEYDSYVTPDGKFLFPEGYNLEETPIVQTQETEELQPSPENTISSEELIKFINCLKEDNFIIYGANWCGWTKKLVEMLGGFDMVKPIYIECTDEKELCEEKGITGYPTIFINGEKYQGARTFEEFATATGCQTPSGIESISVENSEDGDCQ